MWYNFLEYIIAEQFPQKEDIFMDKHYDVIIAGTGVGGLYTALCLPSGQVIFNTTGNAGMATAGCGDVLTGVITGLLARGYQHQQACMLGMYLHGLAGDLAVRTKGMESLVASDIVDSLPAAFRYIED